MEKRTTTRVECKLDGELVHYLPSHLAEKHGMSLDDYLEKHPGAPVESETLTDSYAQWSDSLDRRAPPPPSELELNVGGYWLRVNPDVPEEACLPLPPHYRLPTEGELGKDVKRSIRHFLQGRSQWIWGSTGCGKDALPSALCAWTRTPSALFPVNPDTDIMAWFYDKNLAGGDSCWVYGELFNALVHGYTSPLSGRRVPMTIVLSDFDRASRAQAEALRLVGDTIQGRVKGARGETFPVLPGTRIIVTANTMGGGDATGKSVSANVLDSSIINRIERKIRFHLLDWKDEKPVIEAKFPLFARHYSQSLEAVGNATAALREAVVNEELYGEFSHRDLCTWIGECEDIIETHIQEGDGALPKDILGQGFRSYSDGLSDAQNKALAESLVDPHIKDGVLPRGNVTGTKNRPLEEELSL